ncbi:VOC family protein [Arthrobacter sp. efr-133-TYG-118]|uniref:VOC family protein n=1 Tax=Arthrobacter sp. efr-133-TYG-118 TaxID=3040279 RepID=UPI00254CCF6C|nr:VOC family protein [Arthrobacter sp. efr-133-TYG-118]
MLVNHIGITVGDIDAGVEFYSELFNLRLLVAPHEASIQTAAADRRKDVFGEKWKHMRLAHLSDGSGVGIELFEFIEPAVEYRDEHFEYWKAGIHHLAFTVEDLDASIEKLIALGGRTRSQIHTTASGTRVRYCEDPWGTPVELVSTSYHELVS